MGDSLQKAFVGVIALGVAVIAIELIPVSRNAEIKYQCALRGNRLGGKFEKLASNKLVSITGVDDLRLDAICHDWIGSRGAH